MRDVCVFYTDEKSIQPLTLLFPGCEKRKLPRSPDRSLFCGFERRHVILAAKNEDLQRITALCRGMPFAGFSVYPPDAGYEPDSPIGIDVSKPRLDYLEAEICHVCNLNCRACTNFSNLRQKTGFYPPDAFERDLRRLKELFWGVTKIRLMGGEPLINPRAADYAEICREIFPDCDLRIVSNGLLLPKTNPDTLRRIRQSGGSFDISSYPPTVKNRKEIEKAAKEAGLTLHFGLPIAFFFKFLLETPVNDPHKAFRACMFSSCHMLEDGFLAPCANAMCVDRFNAFYGKDYPQTDRFDIFDPTLDGWKILDAFSKPHEFCRCCSSGMVPIPWKGNVGPKEAEPGDWLIGSSPLTSLLIPAVHRVVLPAAERLRRLLQKNG